MRRFPSRTMCVCSVAIFAWLQRTEFRFHTLRLAARRLAKATGFTLAEIEAMPFYEVVWWLKDE